MGFLNLWFFKSLNFLIFWDFFNPEKGYRVHRKTLRKSSTHLNVEFSNEYIFARVQFLFVGIRIYYITLSIILRILLYIYYTYILLFLFLVDGYDWLVFSTNRNSKKVNNNYRSFFFDYYSCYHIIKGKKTFTENIFLDCLRITLSLNKGICSANRLI